MNKKQKFKSFLEALKGHGQDTLIENVKKGFNVCFESSAHEEWVKANPIEKDILVNRITIDNKPTINQSSVVFEDANIDLEEIDKEFYNKYTTITQIAKNEMKKHNEKVEIYYIEFSTEFHIGYYFTFDKEEGVGTSHKGDGKAYLEDTTIKLYHSGGESESIEITKEMPEYNLIFLIVEDWLNEADIEDEVADMLYDPPDYDPDPY